MNDVDEGERVSVVVCSMGSIISIDKYVYIVAHVYNNTL